MRDYPLLAIRGSNLRGLHPLGEEREEVDVGREGAGKDEHDVGAKSALRECAS